MSADFSSSCPLPVADCRPILTENRATTSQPHRSAKPRLGVFSLTSCEGCSLSILELEDELLAILGQVDIVNFREAATPREWDLDLALVDGAVSTPADEQHARHIRDSARCLVAIGACACLGGVNTMKNHQPIEEVRRNVYGEKARIFPTHEAKPLAAVVPVDYELPGCPMVGEEFLRFLKFLLMGRTFRLPNYPVCVECKRAGHLCQVELGNVCLGPITRAGCDAICPRYGAACEGCRGILSDEVRQTFVRNAGELYRIPREQLLATLRHYGAFQGELEPAKG